MLFAGRTRILRRGSPRAAVVSLVLLGTLPSPLVSGEEPPPNIPVVTMEVDPVLDLLERITRPGRSEEEALRWFEDLVQRGDSALPRLVKVYTQPIEAEARRWVAARALGRIGGELALSTLRAGLTQNAVLDRMAAVSGLTDLKAMEAIPDLERALLADPAMTVRMGAADALGAMGARAPLPTLLKALDAEANYHQGRSLPVRSHIVAALANTFDPAVVPRLVGAASDPDGAVRSQAQRGLLRLVPPADRPSKLSGNSEADGKAWKTWWEERKGTRP